MLPGLTRELVYVGMAAGAAARAARRRGQPNMIFRRERLSAEVALAERGVFNVAQAVMVANVDGTCVPRAERHLRRCQVRLAKYEASLSGRVLVERARRGL